MKTALIIGGGFAGCCAAHHLTMAGFDVTLVEKSGQLGAGVRTEFYGGHPYTFGPRHLISHSQRAWDYMNAIVPLRDCSEHEFLSYVEADGQFWHYPIHEADVVLMPDAPQIEAELKECRANPDRISQATTFEEYWLSSVGKTLYGKFVDDYSKKMWQIDSNEEIDTFNWSPKGVALRPAADPFAPRWGGETRSSYPIAADGYNRYFDVATAGAKVLLNTEIYNYDLTGGEGGRSVLFAGEAGEFEWRNFDLVISTVSPDILFDDVFGELPYIGRDLTKIILPIEFAFPENVFFTYYTGSEQFTRIVEYKKFTKHKSPHTLIGIEFPSKNGKFYPMPQKSAQALARRYHEAMMSGGDGVFSIGRNGSYRYSLDCGAILEQVFVMMDQIKQGGQDYAVPGEKWR